MKVQYYFVTKGSRYLYPKLFPLAESEVRIFFAWFVMVDGSRIYCPSLIMN